MMTDEKIEEWLNHVIRIPVGLLGILAVFIGIYCIGDVTISVLDSSIETVFFTVLGGILIAYAIRGNEQIIPNMNEGCMLNRGNEQIIPNMNEGCILQLVREGNISIIGTTLRRGFTSGLNLNLKDDVTGETPLDYAIKRNLTEIALLLSMYGGKTSEELNIQRN